jgi:hypothetical protein
MRRIFALSLAALLGTAAVSQAGVLSCRTCGQQCNPIPCPDCPDCSGPCEHRMHLALLGGQAEKLIEGLSSCECCVRIKAVKKLGCRLHADFCSEPCVLNALLSALLCDRCWEVRRHAAWSLMLQGARTEQGLVALYISSKLDPHYMVRARALEALDILTLCRRECYKGLFEQADGLIKDLRAQKFVPGSEGCNVAFEQLGGSCVSCLGPDGPAGLPVEGIPLPKGGVPGELIPGPKTGMAAPPGPVQSFTVPVVGTPYGVPPSVARPLPSPR